MYIVFWLLLDCIKMVQGLGTDPYQEITHMSCARLIKYLSVSGTVNTVLSLLKACVSYGTWSTPMLMSIFCWRETGFLLLWHKGLQVRETVAKSDWHTFTEADLAMSLLCVISKSLFHPLFDCVMFSLVSKVPTCSEEVCLKSYPGFDNQYPVFLELISGAQNSAQQ